MKPHPGPMQPSKLDLPERTAVKKMQITSIIPVRANVGEHISIFGRNFGRSRDIILFGNKKAQEYHWGDQRIDVKVPFLSPGYYKITIVKGSESATSKKRFKLDPFV